MSSGGIIKKGGGETTKENKRVMLAIGNAWDGYQVAFFFFFNREQKARGQSREGAYHSLKEKEVNNPLGYPVGCEYVCVLYLRSLDDGSRTGTDSSSLSLSILSSLTDPISSLETEEQAIERNTE